MDINAFRKAGYEAIDRICDYHTSLEKRSVVPHVLPGYLKELLPEEAPETGEDFQTIADDYQKCIMPGITHWQHPSFFAYYPTPCTFEAILAELYASSTPNPGFNWSCSPACTELETIAMDWAAKLFGLADHFLNTSCAGGGVLESSASESALVAIVAARALYRRRHTLTGLDDLVIYTTTQTHSLGKKAGLILGLECRSLEVNAEDDFALRGDTLRRAIDSDTENGKHPFILVATVGTTSSGAIDRLDEIGAVLQEYPSIWLHVDAAWAGVALACPELREMTQLRYINEFADSFCTNFHKWGLVNLDASALWVKNRKHIVNTLDVTPEFLRTKEGDTGAVTDYRNWHLGLSRRFRSLKLWFVLRGYGAEGFRRNIRQGIELNDYFVSLVRASKDFSLVTKPSLALSVFRLEPALATFQDSKDRNAVLNDLNELYYARLSKRHDIFLTQTKLNGIFCIRFAIGAVRTNKEHIDRAWHVLQQEAGSAIIEWEETRMEKSHVTGGCDVL